MSKGPARKPLDELFRSHIHKTDACWLWTAARNNNGYGVFHIGRKSCSAHRVAYELFVGPIPQGLHIDHLCRVRHCVRPSHLEPVTCQVNNQRAKAVITSCPKGHELAGSNLYVYKGNRDCRTCRHERTRIWNEKQRAA